MDHREGTAQLCCLIGKVERSDRGDEVVFNADETGQRRVVDRHPITLHRDRRVIILLSNPGWDSI